MIALTPYKMHVEKIVCPIAATHRTKNRMRRELWAHFVALAEDEGGDAAAYERALVRLGDPAELRAELESTVTKDERVSFAVARFSLRTLDEPVSRFALRLLPYFAVLGAVVIAVIDVLIYFGTNGAEAEHLALATAVEAPLVAWLYTSMLIPHLSPV